MDPREGIGDRTPAFKAFLSHRYRSPEINLHFYGICSQVSEIQFEIDEQDAPISMARLERMVRDADAFIGIYPFPASSRTVAARTDLLSASRYFRLELGLAARVDIPILVFLDERYHSVLPLPPSAIWETFDQQEITGRGGIPSEQRHRIVVSDFYREVSANIAYRAAMSRRRLRTGVGLLLPPDLYPKAQISDLAQTLEARGYKAIRLPWPLSVDVTSVGVLTALDWLVFDTGDSPEGAVALGWLDGHGIPMAGRGAKSFGLVRWWFGWSGVGP